MHITGLNELGILVPQNDYRYNSDINELQIYKDFKIYCLNCRNPIVDMIRSTTELSILANIFADEKRKNRYFELLEELEAGEKCIKLEETLLYDSRIIPPKEYKYFKVLINGNTYWTHSNNFVSFNKYKIDNIIIKFKYKK